MSSQHNLVTQSQLTDLNQVLQIIAANLNQHVNASLSKAHGINAQIGNYYDDRGDLVGTITLEFQFGTAPNVTTLYVPAIISALPSTEGTGLITNPNAPGGSNSIGVPLSSKALVTTFTEETRQNMTLYNNMLLAHISSVQADTGDEQAHGGTSRVTGDIVDSLGHAVGTEYIVLGINGTAYHLPASPFSTGVPQIPRNLSIAMSPVDSTFTLQVAGYYQHNQNRSGGKTFAGLYPSGIVFTTSAQGSSLSYQWYYYSISQSTVPSLSDPSWIVCPASISGLSIGKSKFSFTSANEVLHVTATTTNGDFSDLSSWFKCVVTNPAGSATILLRFRTHES